jgi:hypothetical protein
MMKATYLRNRHNGAIAGRRDRTRNRRVFVQRQVCAGLFVVRTIQVSNRFKPASLNTIT